jgi:NTE family protein
MRGVLALFSAVCMFIFSLFSCATREAAPPVRGLPVHTLFIEAEAPGGTVSPRGTVEVLDGASLRIVLEPRYGYTVDTVRVDGVPVPPANPFVLDAIRRGYEIEVTFRRERICLVLSVGGSAGIAHIGAIRALEENGIIPSSVYGNSMGAVIGALYASAPRADLKSRYSELMNRYIERSKAEASIYDIARGVLSDLAELLFSPGTSGGGSLFGLGKAGGLPGAKADIDRFRRVLDGFLSHKNMEDAILPFAVSYQEKKGEGLLYRIIRDGNMAEAVSRSANNPYIFQNTNLDYIDPGADRMSAVPIEDAYRTFKPERIIAVNAHDRDSVYTGAVLCPVDEIAVSPGEGDPGALSGRGAGYERLVETGYLRAGEFLRGR